MSRVAEHRDAAGTPSAVLPLLFAMRERGGEGRAPDSVRPELRTEAERAAYECAADE